MCIRDSDEHIEFDSIVPRIYRVTRLLTELGKP